MAARFYKEESHVLPVPYDGIDVLVAGGGPAGVGAALAAARTGARTLVLEQANALGGMATCGMMSHWSGSQCSPVLREITARMKAKKSLPQNFHEDVPFNISHECLKQVLFEIMQEASVAIQLHTFVADVIMDDNVVKGVITESKSGREAIFAKVVIDATGDGDIAAKAGAAYSVGREEDHRCQPATMMFRIGGVDYQRAVFPGSFESYIQTPKGEIQSLGRKFLSPPAGHVLLYQTRLPGEVCVNMTNAVEIDGTDVRDITKAEMLCRAQMDEIVAFLREYAPGYENCYLVTSAQNVGIRETRHFRGLYTLTGEDIVDGKVFDDWIAARNYFNFDIHSLHGAGLDANGAQKTFRAKGEYTVPFRACIPEKIDALLLSGRNISGTHLAHSNFRVMAICLNIGYGVGVAAALAAHHGLLPREVNISEVQDILRSHGISP